MYARPTYSIHRSTDSPTLRPARPSGAARSGLFPPDLIQVYRVALEVVGKLAVRHVDLAGLSHDLRRGLGRQRVGAAATGEHGRDAGGAQAGGERRIAVEDSQRVGRQLY